jgi:hypothetical protein
MIVPGRTGEHRVERNQPVAHAGDLPGGFVTGAVIADIVFGDEVRALMEIEVVPGHEPYLLS